MAGLFWAIAVVAGTGFIGSVVSLVSIYRTDFITETEVCQ